MSIASEISRLQTAKAGLKTAIEAKGVTVPSATTLDGYPALVGAIPSGGSSIIEDYANAIIFQNADFTSDGIDEITITSNYSGTFVMTNMFSGAKIKKVTVSAHVLTRPQYGFLSSTVEEIILNSGTGFVSGEFQSFIQNAQSVKKVLGSPLDLYSSSNTNAFYFAKALEEIRFKPSSITNKLVIAQSDKLTNDSIVSVANGLRSDVSGKTLTLHTTVKDKLSTIMGTVTDGVFTADASGQTTLQNFITATKGWTIA